MDKQEQIYRSYLEQMQELSEFLLAFNSKHQFSGLKPTQSTDDPDILRLLESLAFFSARTHNTAIQNEAKFRNRFFQQLLPHFITPLPASGIIRALPSGGVTEGVKVPSGTGFILRSDTDREFFFQSRGRGEILPIALMSLHSLVRESTGHTLRLEFRCAHPIRRVPHPFSLYINYLGDVHFSYQVLGYIKRHAYKAWVHFGELDNVKAPRSLNDWTDLGGIEYGGVGVSEEEEDFLHPVEVERLFFQDPRSDLYFHLSLPEAFISFTKFFVDLDFDVAWPKGLTVSKDIFEPYCFQVLNLVRAHCSSIMCDGTQSRFPLLCSKLDQDLVFFKSIGVYRLTEDSMEPLVPGVLSTHNGTYDIETGGEDIMGRPVTTLQVNMPEAFLEPCPIHVDALWTQPSYQNHRDRPYQILPYTRTIVGVTWDWAGLPAHRNESVQESSLSDRLLNLIFISHRQYLSFGDMRAIMEVMGIPALSLFRNYYAGLTGVRFEHRSVKGSTLTAGYTIYFLTFDWSIVSRDSHLFEIFMDHFEKLLNLISSDREIKLTLENFDNSQES